MKLSAKVRDYPPRPETRNEYGQPHPKPILSLYMKGFTIKNADK